MARRAPRRAVLAVGVTAPLAPASGAGARGAAGAVSLDVLAQVIASHEALVAHGASKPLLAGVRAQMPLELVGAREPLAAKEPVAHERSLARVPPQVRLQVRRLAVDLPAAGDVAAVEPLPTEAGARRAQPLRLLAVGTVTGGSARVASGGRPWGRGQRRGRSPGEHSPTGSGQRRRARVRVRGEHRLEAVHQMLPGGQQVRGGTRAERGVTQR